MSNILLRPGRNSGIPPSFSVPVGYSNLTSSQYPTTVTKNSLEDKNSSYSYADLSHTIGTNLATWYYRYSWLKFSVPIQPGDLWIRGKITSKAVLVYYDTNSTTSHPDSYERYTGGLTTVSKVYFFYEGGSTWDVDTLCWNNQPALSSPVLTIQDVVPVSSDSLINAEYGSSSEFSYSLSVDYPLYGMALEIAVPSFVQADPDQTSPPLRKVRTWLANGTAFTLLYEKSKEHRTQYRRITKVEAKSNYVYFSTTEKHELVPETMQYCSVYGVGYGFDFDWHTVWIVDDYTFRIPVTIGTSMGNIVEGYHATPLTDCDGTFEFW